MITSDFYRPAGRVNRTISMKILGLTLGGTAKPIPLPSAFGRIVHAAHECSIIQAATAAPAVRCDVVDREIAPRELGGAARMCTGEVCRAVPYDPALLASESALGILAGEKASEISPKFVRAYAVG